MQLKGISSLRSFHATWSHSSELDPQTFALCIFRRVESQLVWSLSRENRQINEPKSEEQIQTWSVCHASMFHVMSETLCAWFLCRDFKGCYTHFFKFLTDVFSRQTKKKIHLANEKGQCGSFREETFSSFVVYLDCMLPYTMFTVAPYFDNKCAFILKGHKLFFLARYFSLKHWKKTAERMTDVYHYPWRDISPYWCL